MGNRKNEAKEMFWGILYALVKEKYFFHPIQSVDKLSMEYVAAASGLGKLKQSEKMDNRLIRIQVSELSASLMDFRGNSGYFYEYDCDDIMEIRDICNNTHCQTIGVIGNVEILKPLIASGIHGVDRIVPIGHTMDFDLVWDGYNLVEKLTRTISISS
jgi:alanyl-tRNA synthetase